MSPSPVRVDLGDHAYEVVVGRGVLGSLPGRVRAIVSQRATRAFVVIDSGVPQRHASALVEGLGRQGLAVSTAVVTPSEAIKSIGTWCELLARVAGSGHTRVDPIIALGGGVVGDLAGFVAACYQRGVPVVQCPTTLLAMVDASVGGKTGVNLAVPGKADTASGGQVYKNMVGAFHQPALVCADIGVLDSLDQRHRRCGLSECVKHAMIGASVGGTDHAGLLDWMLGHLGQIASFDEETIVELVERNVALKAAVVMGDERESPDAPPSGRMLLNLGHTFGHAIETQEGIAPERGGLFHGEAVALGMVAACATGQQMGLCDASVGRELRMLLETIGLPTSVGGLDDDPSVIARMGHDKKSAGGTLRVILPIGRGKCSIVSDADASSLRAGIGSIRATAAPDPFSAQ